MKRKKRKVKYPIRLTINLQPELYLFLDTLRENSDESIAEWIRQMVMYFKDQSQSIGYTDEPPNKPDSF